MRIQNKILSIFFLVVVFSPLLIVKVNNSYIQKSIVLSLDKNWLVDGQKVNFPHLFEGESSLIYSNEFKISSKKQDLGFYIPSIGDADSVTVNDCLIGSTGVSNSNQQDGWFWGKARLYRVDRSCLKDGFNKINITVYPFSLIDKGVLKSGLGIVDFDVAEKHFRVDYLMRYSLLVFFGSILIFLSLYYAYLYFMLRRREYAVFSLFALTSGLYEIFLSFIPYEIFNSVSCLRAQIFFGLCSGYFYFKFFNFKLNYLKSEKIINIFFAFSLVGFAASFMSSDFKYISMIYQIWMSVYLLGVFASLIKYLYLRRRNKTDLNIYAVLFIVYSLFLVHDVVLASTHNMGTYLAPYGFLIIVTVAALFLAQEYADAFLYVEAQVEDRTRDLNKAIEDLKGLEKMKQRFFANISHDLKTPITVALGAIEETKSRFANVLGGALSPADRALHKLKTMVSSILDSVKAESGELALQWQSISVQNFMEDIAQDAVVLCRQAKIIFEFNPKGFAGLQVPMDSGKMQRVMENIISNAVKYTSGTDRSVKKVSIHLETDQSQLHIYVDDSGIGVPEQERDKVFERYVQSSLTDLKVHGGSGIGLSFVREMIYLHNGQVEMLESPLGGSRVHIQLPLSQDVTLTQVPENNRLSGLKGSLDVQYPPTEPKLVDPSKPILLTCEDNPEVAQIIWNALQDEYNIYFAENGQVGLSLLERISPDCILSDVQMPVMDGHSFLAAVRKISHLDAVPFIYLTSLGADQDVVDGFKLGASDYIAKPFKKEVLLTRIKAHVERKVFFERLSRSEKMSTIGTMFAGIAHEMKNPLQSLVNNQSMIHKIVKDKKFEDKYETLERSIVAARKKTNDLTDLISTVNEYSSGSEMKTTIDLKKKTRDILSLLENKRKEKNFLQVEIHEPDEPITIEGYNSIQQAMMNLVSNAFDATQDKETDRIDIFLSRTTTQVLFEVKDTGSGISPKVLPHIFDPFVTTKDPTKGTGLGLFLSKTIVEEKHGGLIKVQTQEGVGTRFTMSVPFIAPDHIESHKPFHSNES